LTFEYVETYSFQRGPDFENKMKLIKPEYDRLKVRKEKRDNLTQLEADRFEELDNLLGFTQYILNDKGQFHPSSIKTKVFSATDPRIDELKDILRTEVKHIPSWMCAPFYRDAFVFYDKANKIVSTLNVCLSCEYMATKKFSHINADEKTYKLFRQFFLDIGHSIEEIG
jgi:hypothetical protein